ncbi:hypothetical protein BGW39_011515 [Mortierella sp. 14UC]|nr:hypothetical protein BGW39_011515 [Mortierella sp. 14UC]
MGTPINTSATALQLQTASPSPQPSAWRSRRHCTGCGGHRIADDHEAASSVCMDCGLVVSESMLEDKPRYQGYGLTRVTAIGREYPSKKLSARDLRLRSAMGDGSRTSLHNTQAGTEARFHSRAYLRQVEGARGLIMSAGKANGLSDVDVKRATFLFLLIKKKMPGQIGNLKALACLYIAAREAGKGLRLLELAAQFGLSPFKFGADYKKVRSFLLQRKTIDTSSGFYIVEDDPWTELERILTIGHSESIERGDFEDLSQDIKDALGVNMEPTERSRRLRGLLSMAQKCMIVATDASLDDARRIQPLVGACLVVALEVRLQLAQSPHELLQWIGNMYSSPPSTIKSRYRELRKCLLEWARRLPFVDKSAHVTERKLIYFLEDVIKYFGHLQEKNRQLWVLLDRTAEEDEREGDVDHAEEIGEDNGYSPEDAEGGGDEKLDGQAFDDHQEQNERSDDDGPFSAFHYDDVPLASEDIRSSMPARRRDPPAYIAKVQRQQRLGELIQKAKQPTSDSTVPTERLCPIDSRRLAWIRRLLDLGRRTERDIMEASDNCLADWVHIDEAHQAREQNARPREDLDSAELTEKDLDDEELACYIRSKPDREVVQRVMHKAHLEFEQAAKLAEMRQHAKESSKKMQLQRKRKREGLPSDKNGPSGGGKRERSRKLRLEALGDSDNEFDATTKNLPRPGQLIIHRVQEPSADQEAEGQGVEVYGDVNVEDEADDDIVGYGDDVGDYDFDNGDDGYEFDYGSD